MKRQFRDSPRIHMPRLKVSATNADFVLAGNLSAGGVGFESRLAPEIGETILVEVELPDEDERVYLPAEVRHVRRSLGSSGAFYVGARFVDVDALVQRPLERFVEERAVRSLVASSAAAMIADFA